MNIKNYKLPTLGSDMEHAIITKWFIKNGDFLKKGDPIAEVETEKQNIEINAWEEGKVNKILYNKGSDIKVGTPIFEYETTAEDKDVKYSPRAKKLIKDSKLDTKNLIEKIEKETISGDDILELDNPKYHAQNFIAKLVERSKREIPHFYIEKEINHQNLINWIYKKNETLSIEERILPIAYYIKAIALSLGKYPIFNSSYSNEIQLKDHIGVAIITSLRNGSIIAPVIHSPQTKSIETLMKEIKALILKGREGVLKREDLTNATISLTNLGEDGADKVYGIIYPPQTTIIGIGGTRINQQCCWTLSVDHRVSNGLAASKFINYINTLIINPEQLEA